MLAKGLDLARDMKLEVRNVSLTLTTFSLELKGNKTDVDRYAAALQQEGWTVGVPTAKDNNWILEGERP